MGFFVDGQWRTQQTFADSDGEFKRKPTTFRHFVAEGTDHPPETGRYHLYVSYACPWAHRTLIVRKLLGLEDAISLSVVNPLMGEDGWSFEPGPGVVEDPQGAAFLREVYLRADARYTGRVTVPILWDKERGTIVNNESSEIIQMLADAFEHNGAHDFYPQDIRDDVLAMIAANYEPINNGVYRSGFARTQQAYEEAVTQLFARLDALAELLSEQRYLLGNRLTAADICLFTTLVRFDPVYHFHFKCNLRRLQDYEHLWGFTRDVYQTPGVAEVTNHVHIKQHYYRSHESVNPSGVVPVGPRVDFEAPHGRG